MTVRRVKAVGVLGMNLRSYIRDIADFPTPGILFRDITPLLSDASALKYAVDRMLELCEPLSSDVIVSVEARGFLLAAPLAYRHGQAAGSCA